MSRQKFFLFFFTLGIVSIIAQAFLLRELMVTFYGNELFLGLSLAFWLLWTGLGSFLASKVSPKLIPTIIATLLTLPLTLLAVRFVKTLFPPGEIPNFFLSMAVAAVVLFPLCLTLGALFTFGIEFCKAGPCRRPASRAYLFETLGFVLGGLLFSFFLVKLPIGEAVNTPYGRIEVVQSGDQINFFESGVLLGPDRDTQGSENLIHLTLLHHPNPQKVLLIGGGFNGPILEILKYSSILKIDYVELDPELIKTALEYLDADLKRALADPKVHIKLLDGRRFVKEATEKYDVIIVNLPNPGTALLNRFYTREFFDEVKKILTDEGILATTLSIPTDYLSSEAENLGASVYKTLQSVFPEVKVLAEYDVLFLASPQGQALQMLKGRALPDTVYLTEDYLTYRLQSDRNRKIERLFRENQSAKINLDFHPIAYFYQTAFWQTYFSFAAAKVFGKLLDFNFWWLVGGWFLLAVLGSSTPLLTMGVAGFTMMALEVLLIFIFQARLGYIYHKIALLMALALLGMAGGNYFASKLGSNLVKMQLLIAGFCLSLIPILKVTSTEGMLLILTIIGGFLIGTIFPLVSRLYPSAGKLYAADLFGSFLGALLPSILLIPILGVNQTILLLVLLNTALITNQVCSK